jgi:molybdenum cofactor synthesis domain-containing protein
MTDQKIYTACVLIIGNEVLSGRTADANLNWIATRLTELGIRMMEARVIPDLEDVIVDTVNECRVKFDYLFTTGGIGPTHDDITAASIAKAFGVEIERNAEAVALLESYIPAANLNEARLKMAEIPVGAELVFNPVSKAPGFRMDNVYVMAGVPSIMRAMFDGFAPLLVGGDPVLSQTVAAELPEGAVAGGLGEIQSRYPDTDIGSYPAYSAGKFKTSLVVRGTDRAKVNAAIEEIRKLICDLGADPVDEEAD